VPAELASTVQALRALIDETRRSEAPDATLVRARELIDAASALLRPHRFEGEAMQSTLRGPNAMPEVGDMTSPALYFPYSPIVGPLNAIAPPVRLHFDGDRMRGRLILGAPYAGPPGCVHGGVVALIFDELRRAQIRDLLIGLLGFVQVAKEPFVSQDVGQMGHEVERVIDLGRAKRGGVGRNHDHPVRAAARCPLDGRVIDDRAVVRRAQPLDRYGVEDERKCG